ncbi:MAG: segregation/condensation protein A [Myxococcales bacterium]|nr:segregation/condensation protein A [Myxococcales bacterium]
MIQSSGYNVELDVFEGPLDLLLHLVKKHELDIIDIPISFVTEKYLEYLDLMKSMDLDVAGEYLLMAATLAYIKSRELLPPTEAQIEADEAEAEEGEEADPRQELIRRLLEYQKYKEAGEMLGARPVVGRNIWTRGAPQDEVLADAVDTESMAPLAPFPVTKLLDALDRLLSKAKISVSHNVAVDRLSVSQCINVLSDRLETEGRISLSSCFTFLHTPMSESEARHEVVVTFLSILEMGKVGLIRVTQVESTGNDDEEIHIESAVEALKEKLLDKLPSEDDYR